MSKMKTVTLKVSFKVPEGTPAIACTDYVREAVESWRGQLRPAGGYNDQDTGDPMWYLDPDSVKVVRYVKK